MTVPRTLIMIKQQSKMRIITVMSMMIGLMSSMCWFDATDAISTFERPPHRYQQNDGRYFSYQNSDGQFHLGNWTVDGVTTGNFGWLDSVNGIETALQYIADDKGYRIINSQRMRHHPNVLLSKSIKTKHEQRHQKPIEIVEDLIADHEHAIIDNKFDYVTQNSFRVEQKRKTGIIYGKYGFVDANGRLNVIHYTAHARRGFLATRHIYDSDGPYNIDNVYKMPLRDVAAEFNLKEYYRDARE